MVENKGNLITRRSFIQRDGVWLNRVELLADVVRRTGATAYKMCEEVGLFGSGTPSPLHVLCELIRKLDEKEREEGAQISAALEMAEYPLTFFRQLHAANPSETDSICTLNFLLKKASDANYQLGGRDLKSLTLGELKDFRQKVMSVETLSQELGLMTDRLIEEAESKYPGAPVQKERPATLRQVAK